VAWCPTGAVVEPASSTQQSMACPDCSLGMRAKTWQLSWHDARVPCRQGCCPHRGGRRSRTIVSAERMAQPGADGEGARVDAINQTTFLFLFQGHSDRLASPLSDVLPPPTTPPPSVRERVHTGTARVAPTPCGRRTELPGMTQTNLSTLGKAAPGLPVTATYQAVPSNGQHRLPGIGADSLGGQRAPTGQQCRENSRNDGHRRLRVWAHTTVCCRAAGAWNQPLCLNSTVMVTPLCSRARHHSTCLRLASEGEKERWNWKRTVPSLRACSHGHRHGEGRCMHGCTVRHL
jgi:hypothetical protein